MVKRIVELSQGVIEVESQPEQGSLFRVILPK
jgi:signal transduction histidine kinase